MGGFRSSQFINKTVMGQRPIAAMRIDRDFQQRAAQRQAALAAARSLFRARGDCRSGSRPPRAHGG